MPAYMFWAWQGTEVRPSHDRTIYCGKVTSYVHLGKQSTRCFTLFGVMRRMFVVPGYHMLYIYIGVEAEIEQIFYCTRSISLFPVDMNNL